MMKRWLLARALITLGLLSMTNFSQANELPIPEQLWSEQILHKGKLLSIEPELLIWSEQILHKAKLLNIEPGLLNAIYLQSARQNSGALNQTATTVYQHDDVVTYVLYKGDVYWVIVRANPTAFMSHVPPPDFMHTWEKQSIIAIQLDDADATSFVDLGSGYAKDQHQVYHRWNVIAGADPLTLQVMNAFYVKDTKAVYYTHNPLFFHSLSSDNGSSDIFTTTVITTADALTFEMIDKKAVRLPEVYYAKDRQHVYYAGEIMPNAAPNKFSIVQPYSSYSTDKQTVYLNGKPCPGLDGPTFEALSFEISRDKNNVYLLCQVLKGLDANSVELLSGSNYSPALLKDKEGVYWVKLDYSNKQVDLSHWADQKIPAADPKTFQLLINSYNQKGFYGRDHKQVYYYTKPILGADLNTFQMLRSDKYGIDKKQLYKYGEPLSTADFKKDIYNLYTYLVEDGLFPVAIKYLSQLLAQKNDGDADVYYVFRAQAYVAQGELEKAISDYRSAMRYLKRKAYDDYEVLDLYLKFIPLYIKLKQYDLAHNSIEQAKAFTYKNSRCDRDLEQLNELKADIHAERGERDAAFTIYQRIKNNIDSCYQNIGDPDRVAWLEALNRKLEQQK